MGPREVGVRYRIGQFAELSGVSAKTLRFYDAIGLLRPAGVDLRTRYRHYLPQQLQDLAAIVALKDLGVSLADIRHAVGRAGSRKDRRELLEQLRGTIEHSIKEAEQSLGWINAALDELDDRNSVIPVVVKHRPATRIASVRATVPHYTDILPCERELMDALPTDSLGNLRGVLWHRCADSGSIDGEPFVEVKHPVPSRRFYELKQLPPATVACAYSGLNEEDAERAYCAIRKWMEVRGYSLAGAKREIYLDGMLEIQFPLKSA